MQVHLVDGTYELFRHHFALPGHRNRGGQEVAATRGVVGSVLSLLEEGATHVAVATDHVVESFRNELYSGYKTGEGIEEELHSQFGVLEQALEAAGVRVWAMVEHEADDGLASGAAMAAADPRVERVFLCTPDKDLAQCVEGQRVVQLDRRRNEVRDAKGVEAKFGVPPASIPDYLALVGDSADGFPGLPGWGAKSAATVLARYGRLDAIPESADDWDVRPRGAARLASSLARGREDALLFRTLATLVRDVGGLGDVDDLEWQGPREAFEEVCRDTLESPALAARARKLAAARAR